MTPDQASARIWALVSGFAPNKARRRTLVPLQCFADGSGSHKNEKFFVMAGYVASVEQWAAFAREWQERLDMTPRLPYFKMSEMAQSPERLERAGWFYRVIEDHVRLAISISIPVAAFRAQVKTADWFKGPGRRMIENPYYMAFHHLIHLMAHVDADYKYLNDTVDFIFDYDTTPGTSWPPDKRAWEQFKRSAQPEARALMGDPPIYRNDIDTLPLQAADLWAWWVRKWTIEGVADKLEGPLLFPWPLTRPGLSRIHLTADEEVIGLWIHSLHRAYNKQRRQKARMHGVPMTIPDPSSPLYSLLRRLPRKPS